MLFKRPGEMAIIVSTINAYVYIENLHNFLFPAIENWFDDDEVIFFKIITLVTEQRGLKLFFRKDIKSIIKAKTLDVNLIENFRWNFFTNGP